ncbi:M15 family metallopeptidase [Thalassotalea sp. M1531]|uniref:M15 family metallopeptidase n=1 Tax=Thalassotalea algicola TaxID=2716224 RepID=A0A7Y0LDD1_9GAMM|nr:M15 family metallopeptidase [Thalassotalea algicola]
MTSPLTIDAEVLTGHTEKHLISLSSQHKLHTTVTSAWQKMQQDAQSDGLSLALASSFRSFERQLSIWNRKFTGQLPVFDINEQVVDITQLSESNKVKAIMLFSALPGASRHHWGTDIDVYAPNLLKEGQELQLQVWEYQDQGPMAKLSTWLQLNAGRYGFFRPYDTYRDGVSIEPWHISFAPTANQYQKSFTLDVLEQTLNNTDIEGKKTILRMLPELYKQYIINIGAFEHG